MVMTTRSAISILCVSLLLLGCTHQAQSQQGARPPKTFQECVEQGGKVLKSYPAQCVGPDGVRYIQDEFEPKGVAGRACKDLCGNGTCEEMVCMAVGCPCAETPATCPKDCHH